MSEFRNVLFVHEGPIEAVVVDLNRALAPERPPQVVTQRGGGTTWQIGVGTLDDRYIDLMDMEGFEPESESWKGLGWKLNIQCFWQRGESAEEQQRRCDAHAESVMRKIGKSLRVRCLLLRELQTEVGRFP